MTNEEIDALIKRLLEEKERNDKKASEEKLTWPATAEQNARLTQFCRLHGFSPSEEERANLTKIVENLEKRLRVADKKYRYSAKVSARAGKRDVTKRVWKQKGRKKKNENPDLFDKEA